MSTEKEMHAHIQFKKDFGCQTVKKHKMKHKSIKPKLTPIKPTNLQKQFDNEMMNQNGFYSSEYGFLPKIIPVAFPTPY